MTPSVGELGLGFCNVVGEFDSLLDTIEDEAKLSSRNRIENNDPYSDLGGVVAELANQHKCYRYVCLRLFFIFSLCISRHCSQQHFLSFFW